MSIDTRKIIISGLDNAGKTSILTALDRKYDFAKDVINLKPTIRVEYHTSSFLNREFIIWDMGGQEKFRNTYIKRQNVYFDNTDLLVYIIDIQDKERYDDSLNYLDIILSFFIKYEIDVPIIISFHKVDPELRTSEEINNNVEKLKGIISEKFSSLKILFQQTSIYDLISIVQLISYGLSVFDEKFFDLSELLENYVEEFDCTSLILFDDKGIIISEFYSDNIDLELYITLLESIKEHLFLLKRMEEENEPGHDFFSVENNLISYLHKVVVDDNFFYISVLIQEELKENLLEIFSDLKEEIIVILTHLLK